MSCSPAPDCANVTVPVTISVLPDVVGIGIIVSFCASALLACSTVVVAYVLEMVPTNLLSHTDKAFLQGWRICDSCSRRSNVVQDGHHVNVPSVCRHIDEVLAKQCQEGVKTFLLALSDSQLVTGLAILVATLVQHCSISIYEVQVVANLSWLAGTTHMATLLALKTYFRETKAMRIARAIGMCCNLVLLLFATILSVSPSSGLIDNSANAQCIFSQFSKILGKSVITLLASFISLIASYMEGFSALIVTQKSLSYHVAKHYCCFSRNGPQLSRDDFDCWYEKEAIQTMNNPIGEFRSQRLWTALEIERRRHGLSWVQTKLCIQAVHCDFRDSMLSELPQLLFNLSYGISGIVSSRQSQPDISNSENTVDFGQIVPLFLLILPVFTVLETYLDINKAIEEANGSISHQDEHSGASVRTNTSEHELLVIASSVTVT